MSLTVRIDPATHQHLRLLAEADGVTLQEELARAVSARRREAFFASIAEGYAARSPEEVIEDERELALWDQTLNDGSDL